jgi:putative transposase
MIRTFKYPLLPNQTQEAVLSTWLDACRSLYNSALQDRQVAYDKDKSTLSYYDQTAELTKMRGRLPALKEVPVEVARSALRHLERAFQAFFRRIKSGETPGYPRYKGKGRVRSFNIGCAMTEGDRVVIPKLGPVKFNLYREIKGRIKDVRISRVAGKWFVCFACDLGEAPPKIVPVTHVGIDLGLTDFATLSDGSTMDNPRCFKHSEEVLARSQRSLERKKSGSNNRKKTKIQLQTGE